MNSAYIKDLVEKDYLVSNQMGIFLRDKGIKTVKLFVSIKEDNDKIEELEQQVTEYRSIFKDIKVGSMGNLSSTKKKLKRFMDENPDIKFQDIITATTSYVDSFNGAFKYIKRADYFIYKQNHRGEESSELEIWLEEIKKEPENSDWRTKLL